MPTARAFALVAGDIRDGSGMPLDEIALEEFAAALDDRCAGSSERSFSVRRSLVVGLLDEDADPLLPILAAALGAGAIRVRWSIAAGRRRDELVARAARGLGLARKARDGLIVRTGEPGADRLLDAIAPLLAELLAELTDRQREVARILVLEGGRQADAADALGISRATVSVMAARGRLRAIERLAGAIRAVTLAGALAAEDGAGGSRERQGAARAVVPSGLGAARRPGDPAPG